MSKLDSVDGSSMMRSRVRSERKYERESSKYSTMSKDKSNKMIVTAQERDTRLVRELVHLEDKEVTVPTYVNEVASL